MVVADTVVATILQHLCRNGALPAGEKGCLVEVRSDTVEVSDTLAMQPSYTQNHI